MDMLGVSRLAEEKLRTDGRKLRLAIDGNLWAFKNKTARSETNSDGSPKHIEKTICFRRLVALLGAHVDVVFVFDGDDKPPFKRNKRVRSAFISNRNWIKALIRNFGFEIIDALGEAEAECAWLERNRLVDFVVTDDVDAFMFGCRNLLRTLSPSGPGSKESPAAIFSSVYSIGEENMTITVPGIVLVAMLSGADYCPEGVKNCGIKTALEIAKAGYGEKLLECHWDPESVKLWKADLAKVLRSNKNSQFSSKHYAIVFDESFPSRELFESYLKPAISNSTKPINWSSTTNIESLYRFAQTYLAFDYAQFAKYLAPALLVNRLSRDLDSGLLEVNGTRCHYRLKISEIRWSIDPFEIVKLDEENAEHIAASNSKPQRIWIADYIVMRSNSARKLVMEYRASVTGRKNKSKRLLAQSCTLATFITADKENHKPATAYPEPPRTPRSVIQHYICICNN